MYSLHPPTSQNIPDPCGCSILSASISCQLRPTSNDSMISMSQDWLLNLCHAWAQTTSDFEDQICALLLYKDAHLYQWSRILVESLCTWNNVEPTYSPSRHQPKNPCPTCCACCLQIHIGRCGGWSSKANLSEKRWAQLCPLHSFLVTITLLNSLTP